MYKSQIIEDNQEFEKLLSELREQSFSAHFEVTDYESGFGYITKYRRTINWSPYKQENMEITDITDVDFNAENLVKFGIYDKNEVWDISYIRTNFDEFVKYLDSQQYSTIYNPELRNIKEKILTNLNKVLQFVDKSTSTCVYTSIDDLLYDEFEGFDPTE